MSKNKISMKGYIDIIKIRNSGAEKYNDRNEKLTRVLIANLSRQKSK